jgi:hypothetical protein
VCTAASSHTTTATVPAANRSSRAAAIDRSAMDGPEEDWSRQKLHPEQQLVKLGATAPPICASHPVLMALSSLLALASAAGTVKLGLDQVHASESMRGSTVVATHFTSSDCADSFADNQDGVGAGSMCGKQPHIACAIYKRVYLGVL